MELKDKKRILIVEDEVVLLNMLKDNLSEEGYDVESAKNGEDGLKKAFETHPDLIILDILMPGIDGIEMAKELRKDEWGKDAKIIILTGVSDLDKVQQALENEIFEFLVKSDIPMSLIIDRVKELTE